MESTTISAAKFKTSCLRLMDQVREKHSEIIITKRGKPVAKLVPFEQQKEIPDIFGHQKGCITILGDIVAPIGEEWDADQ